MSPRWEARRLICEEVRSIVCHRSTRAGATITEVVTVAHRYESPLTGDVCVAV